MTLSAPFLVIFFADHMNIFHINLVQTVILKCPTFLNLIWIKGYNMKCKKNNFSFFCNFVKKKPDNLWLKNGILEPFLANFFVKYIKIIQKTEIQMVNLRCLVGLNLNWIKSYGIISVQVIFFHA